MVSNIKETHYHSHCQWFSSDKWLNFWPTNLNKNAVEKVEKQFHFFHSAITDTADPQEKDQMESTEWKYKNNITLKNIYHIMTWTLAVNCSIVLSEQSPLLVCLCVCECNETVCFLLCRGGGWWTNILWCLDAEPILTWVFCNILQVKLSSVETARAVDMVYRPRRMSLRLSDTNKPHTEKTNSCAAFQWKASVVTPPNFFLPQFISNSIDLSYYPNTSVMPVNDQY